MVGFCVSLQTSSHALLIELQNIWTEIGESEEYKGKKLSEIEWECLQIYEKKLDEAKTCKAKLHQLVAAKEAELASIVASLGEDNFNYKDRREIPLNEQLASVTVLLEKLRIKKEERIQQFADIKSRIHKISSEISEFNSQNDASNELVDSEEDLSIKKLSEYHAQLQTLQKTESDRLQKVLQYVNEVHLLCGVLGMDFQKIVNEVHPTLHEANAKQSTNISTRTLEGLAHTVSKLKSEKKVRVQKLREKVEVLVNLWKLMDSPEEDKRSFGRLKYILGSPEEEINYKGVLSEEILEQTEAEVERLKKLKTSRMKELVFKRRQELEEICKMAHMEPDISTSTEKDNAMIDNGIVDASELLANIEEQIVNAKEESMSRKNIMDRISKWLTACEEEDWLQEYNQDKKKYSVVRGAHLNLKRAEKARISVTKIPGMVDNLISRTIAWESERNKPFLYDGVRLVSILEEYKLTRKQKEDERKKYQDQKKHQELLLKQKESMYRSKPCPRRSSSFSQKLTSTGNGFITPSPRHICFGSATPDLQSPRSYSGHHNGHFKNLRRLSATHLSFGSTFKEDTSSSFASISGSEPDSLI